MVYGSDAATAPSLCGAGGTTAVSANINLPINNGMFAASDGRAQDNSSLTALKTLFVRESHYQVGVRTITLTCVVTGKLPASNFILKN